MTRPSVLQVRVNVVDRVPLLTSVCPGYELGEWREGDLARDIFDRHLLSFATNYSSYISVNADNAPDALRSAAKAVYKTGKYRNRGEYGELILHSILRDIFSAEPAVSKLYFKDGPNETVKGFDAVHIVMTGEEMELWLGEVKFYADVAGAISEVCKELGVHLSSDYLKGEFMAVTHKIDDAWPHAARLKTLLDQNTGLDTLFANLTVPVLLTYESDAVAQNTAYCEEYVDGLVAEAEAAWTKFSSKMSVDWKVTIRLILLPLMRKASIVDAFHERLDAWQRI